MKEWKALQALESNRASLATGQKAIAEHRSHLYAEVTNDVKRIQSAGFKSVDVHIIHLTHRINALIAKQQSSMLSPSSLFLDGTDFAKNAIDRTKRGIEIELLSQERDYLKRLQAAALAKFNHQRAAQRLQDLYQQHVSLYGKLQDNLRAQSALKISNPVKIRVFGTAPYRRMDSLEEQNLQLRTAYEAARETYVAQRDAIKGSPGLGKTAALNIDEERVNQALNEFQSVLAKADESYVQNWISKGTGQVSEVLPIALKIMLYLALLPLAGKLLFYFVFAPVAARLPPIYIRQSLHSNEPSDQCGTPIYSANLSRVTQTITVEPGEELLVHPEYIQTVSSSAKKATKWLLNWKYPLTCLAAGFAAMTRVRSSQSEEIVISSSTDPLDEIALISLPADVAMVFQPRSLVGFKYPINHPVAIHRHWRLASLHAWLTLQFRYVVFTGPVTLIVRGCRGVRVESARGGRNISQYATLGFSTNVAYSTIRAEPFIPYLASKQALYHDRFEGDYGVYIYQETPRITTRQSAAGRGSGAVVETLLKTVGI